jgi:hypothetical protein
VRGLLPAVSERLWQVGLEMTLKRCRFPRSEERLPRLANPLLLGQTLSGWRDLNSRPLDPQIGPPRLSSVNELSLVSMLDR